MSYLGRIISGELLKCFCFTNKYHGILPKLQRASTPFTTLCTRQEEDKGQKLKLNCKICGHPDKIVLRTVTNSTLSFALKTPIVHVEQSSGDEFTTCVEPRPTLSVSQVKKILKNNGITFNDGYTCLHLDCPICYLNDIKKRNKVYINKKTGYAVCYDCGYSSHWDSLEKVLVSYRTRKALLPEDLEDAKSQCCSDVECAEKWSSLKAESLLLEFLSDVDRMEIFIKFSLPNVPLPAVKQLQIRLDKTGNVMYFPLFDAGGHVAGYKTFPMKGVEETFPSACCKGIMKIQSVRSSKLETAVLVSSIRDALALASQRMAFSVVCLPHGESVLPQDVLPALERFGKLVLWFGNSHHFWDAARTMARKLGETRCYFVRPTGDQPAPHEALGIGADLKVFVNNAKPIWHKAITTFSALRQDVLAELQNVEKVQGVKWKRFPVLNRIMKGHRRGEFTVLTGPTGCGKTTFMSEYSLDLATQGVSTLWGSFEIRNIRLARTMLQQLAGVPLDDHVEQFETWADAFERLPIYFMTFHGQQPVRVVMEAVEHAAYVHDIAHVIIDNVQFMMGISEEAPKHNDRFWKQDAIVSAFRSFATRANCHVTLVMHPRKEQPLDSLTVHSIFGSAKASQEADNVMIIQDKRLSSVRGKKYLQVAKNRFTGDLGMMPLEFDKDSLSYSLRKKKMLEMVKSNECE